MLFNQVIVSLCLYKEDRESYSLARVEQKGIYSYKYDHCSWFIMVHKDRTFQYFYDYISVRKNTGKKLRTNCIWAGVEIIESFKAFIFPRIESTNIST